MSEALYHEALVARARSGTGKGRLEPHDASARLDNPLCGDRVTLDLRMAGGHIAAIGHEVKGCLLCEAAAATIARHLAGATPAEARRMIAAIGALMKEGAEPAADLSDLAIFTPVHKAKARRDCVLLPFGALERALAGF
ncbi:nitrogen fixation NifU-like protein [Dongia mobilis]|uniref:Nitrogen fixation NifU-like protein n=1 Tax=Dongia mobilis TaxID=578943 RepID=A0A4R6WQQ7_9PROT|nr:iron-sulfur cluster assembly scaffold protein [Dongia mobilis]TDQ83922.1 nitrogen fixation NifU-like protein [Dongia mobilis]